MRFLQVVEKKLHFPLVKYLGLVLLSVIPLHAQLDAIFITIKCENVFEKVIYAATHKSEMWVHACQTDWAFG